MNNFRRNSGSSSDTDSQPGSGSMHHLTRISNARMASRSANSSFANQPTNQSTNQSNHHRTMTLSQPTNLISQFRSPSADFSKTDKPASIPEWKTHRLSSTTIPTSSSTNQSMTSSSPSSPLRPLQDSMTRAHSANSTHRKRTSISQSTDQPSSGNLSPSSSQVTSSTSTHQRPDAIQTVFPTTVLHSRQSSNSSPTSLMSPSSAQSTTTTITVPTNQSPSQLSAKQTATVTTVLISDSKIEVDPYDALTAALVPDARLSLSYHAELKRFYVLALFCCISAQQGMVFCTFSTVPSYANAYFNQTLASQSLLSMLLNWQPIFFIPIVLLAAWFQSSAKDGLKRLVICASAFGAAGSVARAIPTMVSDEIRTANMDGFLVLVHLGQILNACTLPLLMTSPSTLSVTWFADGERATATAMAAISNGFGIGLAYLIFPAVVGNVPDSGQVEGVRIELILRATAIVGLVLSVLVTLYFPNEPSVYPSSLAAQRSDNPSMLQSISEPHLSFSSGLLKTFKCLSFVMLVLAIGVLNGVYGVWSATLPSTLLYTQFDLQQTASFVTVTRFAAIVGGLIMGSLADRAYFRFKQKALISVCLYFSLLSFTLFTFTQPSIGFYKPLLPNSWYFLSLLCVGFGGFFLGGVVPLAYELGAELTYPANESTSAAFITLVMQAAALILLAVSPKFVSPLRDENSQSQTPVLIINSVMVISIAIAMVLVSLIREEYRRFVAGRQFQHRNQGVAAVLRYYDTLEELVSPTNILEEDEEIDSKPCTHV